MKKSRIASPVPRTESPRHHLPLGNLLVDTKTELLELALRSGVKVFTITLEEDRTAQALLLTRMAISTQMGCGRLNGMPRIKWWRSIRVPIGAKSTSPVPCRQ